MASQAPSKPLIVADAGGTNVRFALIGAPGGRIERLRSYKSADHNSFESALETYLGEIGEAAPKTIAIGAAGPLLHGEITLTNIAWRIDPSLLQLRFGLAIAALANDLVAMAAGIARAAPQAFVTLPGPVAEKPHRILVIAVGTGLGVAWFERIGDDVDVHSTEAGHMAYSPIDAAGLKFLESALRESDAISFERVVSGFGFRAAYATMREPDSPVFKSSEEVLVAAESGANTEAHLAVSIVMHALITFARNLVLALGGVDEIVFAGGLGRRLRAELSRAETLARLRDSRGIPLDLHRLAARIALDDTLPLHGAAYLAYGSVRHGGSSGKAAP